MPGAEQRRLSIAAHWALQHLLDDQPHQLWLDLPASVAVAAELAPALSVDVQRVVERAAVALVEAYGQAAPTDEVKAACRAFLPCYEAILATVTWPRLNEAQRSTAAAWGDPRASGIRR